MKLKLITAMLALIILSSCMLKTDDEPRLKADSYILHEDLSVNISKTALDAESGIIARKVIAASNDEEINLDTKLIEKHLLNLINEEREDNDIAPLAKDFLMTKAGRIRAKELLSSFSHIRPDKTRYYTVFDEVGFAHSQKWHGENAAMLIFSSGSLTEKEIAAEMFKDLKESPGHYKNMMKKKYSKIAVCAKASAEEDGYIKVVSVQLFASE